MDRQVTRQEFLDTYYRALTNADNDENNMEKYGIYGKDITVHWNGIYCTCEDGATPYNHIIPAIESVDDELGQETITDPKTQDLATRIYDLVPPWDREEDSMNETIETLKQDPTTIVEYLLDMIDELQR